VENDGWETKRGRGGGRLVPPLRPEKRKTPNYTSARTLVVIATDPVETPIPVRHA